MTEPPRPRRRALKLAALAMLVAAPALWFSSSDLRVGVYEVIYPYLGASSRDAVFKRLYDDERRPDAAWRVTILTQTDAAMREAAWSGFASACQDYGPFLARGAEAEVLAALETPVLAGPALSVLVRGRLRHPRFAAAIRPLMKPDALGEHDHLIGAALAINGQTDEAVTWLSSRVRLAHEGEGRSRVPAPFIAALAIAQLRRIGAAARPALKEIALWRDAKPLVPRAEARAALWAINQDEAALAELREDLASAPGRSRLTLAIILAEVGAADQACLRLLEKEIARPDPQDPEPGGPSIAIGLEPIPDRRVDGLQALARMGPAAAPSRPVIEPLLKHREAGIAEAARRALAAIGEGE